MTDNKYTYRSQVTDESDDLAFEISNVEIDPSTPDEIRRESIKRLIELHRESKPLEMEKRRILATLSDPDKRKEVVNLTISSAQNIMSNCTLTETEEDILYKDFSDKDKQLLKGERGSKINGIFSAVVSDSTVKDGVVAIKELVNFDTRKVRQDKRVGKTLDTLYLHKKQFDQAAQLKLHSEQIARLLLAQKENEDKFNQIGNALLYVEVKMNALKILGVSDKKAELYKLRLQYPSLTQQQLGDIIGKPRLTVIRWLKEINKLTPKEIENDTK